MWGARVGTGFGPVAFVAFGLRLGHEAGGLRPPLALLYGGVSSSSRVCAGVCEGVSIVSYNETCRIDIRSIDD